MCGEGGEFESVVVDCPLFRTKLEFEETELVELGNDYSPVSYLKITKISHSPKSDDERNLDSLVIKRLVEEVNERLC